MNKLFLFICLLTPQKSRGWAFTYPNCCAGYFSEKMFHRSLNWLWVFPKRCADRLYLVFAPQCSRIRGPLTVTLVGHFCRSLIRVVMVQQFFFPSSDQNASWISDEKYQWLWQWGYINHSNMWNPVSRYESKARGAFRHSRSCLRHRASSHID